MWRSKCETCGEFAYIFPDQVEEIRRRSILKLHKYVIGKRLKVGDDWFCVKCDASYKDGSKCKIYAELTGDKASKLIKIRKRETNLKSFGFDLPKLY